MSALSPDEPYGVSLPQPRAARAAVRRRAGDVRAGRHRPPGRYGLGIINFEPSLPPPSDVKQRNAFVSAGLAHASLSEDALRAIARALVDPAPVTAMLREELFIEETAETARLLSLPGKLYLGELFPLIQPRSGASAGPVSHPVVNGILDKNADPEAAISVRFNDPDHLARYLMQVIGETRVLGRKYETSILARRVSRPVLAHAARIDFRDGSDPLFVVAVRDGITRLVSSWAARLDSDAMPETVAKAMTTALLARKQVRGKDATTNIEHARGREEIAAAFRADFAAGLAGGTPNETAIRIGQTFMVPAQICVGVVPGAGSQLAPEDIFDDAQRSVVSSIHVEFKGWDEAAGQVEVIDRAMHRVAHREQLLDTVVAIATGATGVEQTAKVFGDPIPCTPLWRAVYVVAWLTSPPAFGAIKQELRSLLGLGAIQNRRYVGHLAAVVDLPWRSAKHRTLKQARRAWSTGGPIPAEMLGVDWKPTPTKDFTDLVKPALGGDKEARFTLMVAGGIALVADKLLTSSVGSQLATGAVPFRADADADIVVAGLGKTEAGLRMLARAANAFDPTKPAVNSFTAAELRDPALMTVIANAYRVPRIHPDDPSRLAVDNAGQVEAVTEGEIVRLSDPVRAAKAEADAKARKAGKPAPVIKTAAEQAAARKHNIKTGLVTVDDDLTALLSLAPQLTSHPFGTEDFWQELNTTVGSIQAKIFSHKPPADDIGDSIVDDSEDEDEMPYGIDLDGDDE